MQARSQQQKEVFKRGRAEDWTPERLASLDKLELTQLRENAVRLEEAGLAALCEEALKALRPRRSGGTRSGPRTRASRLIARGRAFEARGVFVQDLRTSWGGVRKSDGAVVLALWADAIASDDGRCSYLLWAQNLDGARPWSDSAAGGERLEHCRRAAGRDDTEGLLVYGERLQGHLPEDKARSVLGVDAETVLRLTVEKRGEEYWAVWGAKAP